MNIETGGVQKFIVTEPEAEARGNLFIGKGRDQIAPVVMKMAGSIKEHMGEAVAEQFFRGVVDTIQAVISLGFSVKDVTAEGLEATFSTVSADRSYQQGVLTAAGISFYLWGAFGKRDGHVTHVLDLIQQELSGIII